MRYFDSIGLRGCSLFLIFFSFAGAQAQGGYHWKDHIDYLVQKADDLSMKSQTTFQLNKIYGKDLPVKETWHYTVHEGKVVIFEIRYVIDSTQFTEIYYVDKNRLICSEQYESPYYSDREDDVDWGEVAFYVNNTLRQHVTLGRKKFRFVSKFREFDSLRKFEERFVELRKNREAIE